MDIDVDMDRCMVKCLPCGGSQEETMYILSDSE